MRISDITLKQIDLGFYISIRKTINFMNDYASFSQMSFDCILEELKRQDVLVSDGPLVCFHNVNLNELDVEVGFPITKDITIPSNMNLKHLSDLRVITAIDLGPYEMQDSTLEELFNYIRNENYEMTGEIIYQYLNETTYPAGVYLTKMMIPIA